MTDDTTLAAARSVLADQGLAVHVDRAGHARDVLVVHTRVARLDTVRACTPALHALGFRYVTIEIVPDA